MENIKTKENFIELRAKGLSFSNISDEIGISKPTLIKWSRELEIDIQNLRTIEQEALREKYHITKEKRLELFSESLEKFRSEVAKRDLTDMPTEKVFGFYLKLLEAMRTEDRELIFSERGYFGLDINETRDWKA